MTSRHTERIVAAIMKKLEERDLDLVELAWSDPRILSDDEARDVLREAIEDA